MERNTYKMNIHILSLHLATGHRQFQTEMLGSQCPQWQVSSCSVAECVSVCVCDAGTLLAEDESVMSL